LVLWLDEIRNQIEWALSTTWTSVSGARRAAFFTIYSDTGDEQIAVSLGDDVTLFYEDPDTKPASKKTISFGADISDGK
jgi:hypothetical protein